GAFQVGLVEIGVGQLGACKARSREPCPMQHRQCQSRAGKIATAEVAALEWGPLQRAVRAGFCFTLQEILLALVRHCSCDERKPNRYRDESPDRHAARADRSPCCTNETNRGSAPSRCRRTSPKAVRRKSCR